MCSDPRRNNLLNRILEARFRLEIAEPETKAEAMEALNRVMAEALLAHPKISRSELIVAVADRMRAYRSGRRRSEPFATP
jgi:hypothetical protein